MFESYLFRSGYFKFNALKMSYFVLLPNLTDKLKVFIKFFLGIFTRSKKFG